MKKFSNKILLVLTLAFIVSIGTLTEVHAADADTLVVHYYRYDGDYNPWGMWIWAYEPESLGGADYSFDSEDSYGAVATIDLAEHELDTSTKLGVLVKTADWVKDIGADRYIDLTSPNASGEVHVYLVQNNPVIYYDEASADKSQKITQASFIDDNTIEFTGTNTTTGDKVTVFENGVELTTSNFSINSENVAEIDISSTLDFTKTYQIKVDYGDTTLASSSVSFNSFYSSDSFNQQFAYEGELGAIYSATETTFKVWAPFVDGITLNLYTAGHTASQTDYDSVAGVDDAYQTESMVKGDKGVWSFTVTGDLDGVYYTYSVDNGGLVTEIVDPYAFTAGVNGKRGMVIDLDAYDPSGWDNTTKPDTMNSYTDAIIYELHVRDLTSHETWTGTESYRGKLLGLVESGTTYQSVTTGFDHITELGITHVQLVPVFDHGIIDETRLTDPTYTGKKDTIFNWGYMPENFNVVEGSYSTDPYNGEVRTTEMKKMVQAFHDEDIRVIMDVVYNHTGKSADSNFNILMPGYYYRMNNDGTFSNGSGTGNETASENYMFQKYMIDSLTFWATEYNIDGFRFDLMKLHDVETMQKVTTALHDIDPTIMIYGEPWTGGTSPLSNEDAAYNANLDQMPGVAVFNDDTRDGIKGSVFEVGDKGFVQGNNYADPRVLLGIAGSTEQANMPLAALPKGAWAINPTQTINYATAHDNNTLHDKLVLSSRPDAEDLIRMQRQANAIILTSQGIPFLHAGVEFLHSKPCTVVDGEAQGECDSANLYDHNSYRSPDETNQFDYNDKVQNIETYNFYKALISLRKTKDVFTLTTADEIENHLQIIPDETFGFVSYFLHDSTDYWKTTYVLHNNGDEDREIMIHPGTWNVVVTTDEVGAIETMDYNGSQITNFKTLETITGGETITLKTNESLVMYSTETVTLQADFNNVDSPPTDEGSSNDLLLPIIIVSGVAVIAVSSVVLLKKRAS
jgi:pullulanase